MFNEMFPLEMAMKTIMVGVTSKEQENGKWKMGNEEMSRRQIKFVATNC